MNLWKNWKNKRSPVLTASEEKVAETLLAEWLARPKHRNRMNYRLLGMLTGAARRYARHGPPPTRNQRLGYRSQKKRRAKLAMLATYGDPAAENPRG